MDDRPELLDFELWEAECAARSRQVRLRQASAVIGRWLLAACSSQCPFTVAALRVAGETEREADSRRAQPAIPAVAETPRAFELD